MACKPVCRLCDRLVISAAVTFTGGNLVVNLPAGSYRNGEKYCIVVAQSIPDSTTINAPVVVTIGTGTELYPLTNRCCAQLTACAIRTRTRYSTVVSTSGTRGTFKLLGNACPCPTNNLPSIDGTAPRCSCRPWSMKGDINMEKLYKIKEALWSELDKSETAKSGELKGGELEAIHKLTDAIKNIDKICMLEDGDGYSEDGGDYGRGSSYANRGKHYVRGHYSRDGGMDGYSSRRNRRGRYSRDDGRSEMMEHLEMALDSASDQDKETIKRFMRQLEQA